MTPWAASTTRWFLYRGRVLNPCLTNQCGFWIGVALILLVYFRTRTWSRPIRVLIVIGLVLFSVCFLELLSLFTASLSDLLQSRSIQLMNRVQRCVGID